MICKPMLRTELFQTVARLCVYLAEALGVEALGVRPILRVAMQAIQTDDNCIDWFNSQRTDLWNHTKPKQ
jgi:hypothetical protein